jgi:hypothetical protein
MDHLELAVKPSDSFDDVRWRFGLKTLEGSLDHLAHEGRIRAEVTADAHPFVALPESTCGVISDAGEQGTVPSEDLTDRQHVGRAGAGHVEQIFGHACEVARLEDLAKLVRSRGESTREDLLGLFEGERG